MPRRRARLPDSLELLLDTICNTFGGVLFIAILVVILLQVTGQSSAQPASAPTPDELESLVAKLQEVSAQVSSLEQTQDSQRRLTDQFAPEELRVLLAERNELQASVRTLSSQRDESLAKNSSLRAKIDRSKQDLNTTKQELEKVQAEQARLKARLAADRQARIQTIRTPIVHQSRKQEIALILRYGRMYIWHRYSDSGVRLGLNTDEFAVVAEEKGNLVTRPKPTAGIPLDPSPETRQRILRSLRRFPPGTSTIAVAVRPDTFAQFQHLRDALIAGGYDYRLMPMTEKGPLMDRGGSGGRVQ